MCCPMQPKIWVPRCRDPYAEWLWNGAQVRNEAHLQGRNLLRCKYQVSCTRVYSYCNDLRTINAKMQGGIKEKLDELSMYDFISETATVADCTLRLALCACELFLHCSRPGGGGDGRGMGRGTIAMGGACRSIAMSAARS